MGWTTKHKGKYVTINPNHPVPVAICTDSGFIFNISDVEKQYDWQGNNKIWKDGAIRGKKYLDKPQEQNRPPLVKGDPFPVKNPRPSPIYTPPDTNPALPPNQLINKLNNFNWNT